jgi:hypothetical protein
MSNEHKLLIQGMGFHRYINQLLHPAVRLAPSYILESQVGQARQNGMARLISVDSKSNQLTFFTPSSCCTSANIFFGLKSFISTPISLIDADFDLSTPEMLLNFKKIAQKQQWLLLLLNSLMIYQEGLSPK